MIIPEGKAIILFDGYCHLCSAWVIRLLKTDRKEQFLFAPLNGKTAVDLLQTRPIPAAVDSIILVDADEELVYSDAVLRIARRVGGFYQFLLIGYILPKAWRDSLYRLVARKRFAWFGRRDSCLLPDEKYRSRFLD